MKYTIEGGSLPVAICTLEPGEVMISESGGRCWALGDIETETTSGGGIGKALGRLFTGESLFLSRYIAKAPSEIAFASSFPGCIIPVELAAGESIIVQKKAFMAATGDVQIAIAFQKKLGAGFFGGEGFIMQKVTGPGTAFLEVDGHSIEYTLAAGQKIVCDTGVVAIMDESCTMDIEMVKGLKNMVFGGEGVFNTVVTGPGKVRLQTMTIEKLASLIIPFIPDKN